MALDFTSGCQYREMLITDKACIGCGETFPLSGFYKDSRTKDGRWSRCKSCVRKKRNSDYQERVEVRELEKFRSREWRKNNTERHKLFCKKYYQTHKEEMKQKQREWNSNNREISAKYSMKRRLINSKEDYKKQSAWRKNHPERVREYHTRRKIGFVTGKAWMTRDFIDRLLKYQKGKCANPLCRISLKSGYEIDHIYPLSRGGLHEQGNLQLLCHSCNNRKHAKLPEVWAKEVGLLFV